MKNLKLIAMAWLALGLISPNLNAERAPETAPSYIDGDDLLTTAFESGNTNLIRKIKRQYKAKGDDGLQDQKFRDSIQAKLDKLSSGSDSQTEASDCADCRARMNGRTPMRSDGLGNNNNQFMASLMSLLGGAVGGYVAGSQNSNSMYGYNPYMYGGYNPYMYANASQAPGIINPNASQAPSIISPNYYNTSLYSASYPYSQYNYGQSQYNYGQSNQYRLTNLPSILPAYL